MIQTKSDIIDALDAISETVSRNAQQVADEQFSREQGEEWQAGDYLKHLILSVKPFARALALPIVQLKEMFGTSEDGSMSYEQLVAQYKTRLAEGLRAEDSPNVVPTAYRFPEDVDDDIKGYLIETWEQANRNLIDALESWSEGDLDTYVLPHPAMARITLREMCFFTIYHNEQHGEDIEALA